MSKGWGALAKWAPFFDDLGAIPASWQPEGAGTVIQPSAFQAAGDLLVGTGAGTFERLPKGSSAGQALTVGGADPSGLQWAAVGGALTTVSSFITSAGSLTANVAQALTSISLAAGTWLIDAQVFLENDGAGISTNALWSSTTSAGGSTQGAASAGNLATGGFQGSFHGTGFYAPIATTTIFLNAKSSNSSSFINSQGTGNALTGITAVKVG